MARCVTVLGTAPGPAKSLVAAGLWRLLSQDGYRVALVNTVGADNAPSWAPILDEAHDYIVIDDPRGPGVRDAPERSHVAAGGLADAPILMVADLDRDGALEDLAGTLALLGPDRRDRLAGLVLIQCREAEEDLAAGIAAIERITGAQMLGVLPCIHGLSQEDVGPVLDLPAPAAEANVLTIAAVQFPHLACAIDLAPLQAEPDARVQYVNTPEQLNGADLVLLPGSTDTVADLAWLKQTGLADVVIQHSRSKGATIGVCGGFHMLGVSLHTYGPNGAPGTCAGLGLLPVSHAAAPDQRAAVTELQGVSGLLAAWTKGSRLSGYEVRSGVTTLLAGARPAFLVLARDGATADATDGCMDRGGWTFGTNLQGLFGHDIFRRRFLNALRARRGRAPLEPSTPADVLQERAHNRLAQALRDHIDLSPIVWR